MDKELKERFMAQYWGVKALSFDYDDDNYVVDGDLAQWHECYLLLRPISSLTDEEAIEVAKMQGYIGVSEPKIKLVGKTHITVDQWDIEEPIEINTVDYLRSIGVALPFNGHSVEEMVDVGWIRLVENQ